MIARTKKAEKPRLIIHADDFGASREVNAAVLRAYREGLLTSCSLMVGGEAFQDAVLGAKDHPGLAVGIHLVTVMGRAVLPHRAIPHLVDLQGYFRRNPTWSGLKYYFLSAARRELHQELQAQFERFAATGLTCSHVDSHLHMHVHPVIFDAALELGEQFGIRCMRVPREDLGASLRTETGGLLGKAVVTFIFDLLTRTMRKRLRHHDFVFTDRVYGHLMSGRMDERYVVSVIQSLQPGTTSEIYFHPAVYPAGTALHPREAQCAREFDILMNGSLLRRMEELGIRRSVYRDLLKGAEASRLAALH